MIQSVQTQPIGLPEAPPPTTVRALLLDDSSFDRTRIRRLSRKADFDIELDEVGSIREMDDAVKQASYDLILIDYRLPEGDGIEALNHILQDPRNKDAGKIMITGNAAVETAVQAMRGGCHDFLTKDDIDPQMLQQAMINAMTLARQRQQMAMQAEHQREIIREGLVAALSDNAVTGNVVSLVREQLRATRPDHPQFVNVMDPGEVDALLSGLNEEDDFIFH